MRERRDHTNPVVRFFGRPYRYAVTFSLLLTAAHLFILLDTFVMPKALQSVPQSGGTRPSAAPGQSRAEDAPLGNQAEGVGSGTALPAVTATSYQDGNIEIAVETLRVYDTDVYIADVRVRSVEYLKTAFANNTYGRNINEKVSVMAEEQNAILAINGDYYGFRDQGWVLRNGVVYRSGGSGFALLLDKEGNLSCSDDHSFIGENASRLWQVWSFGPPLVVDGSIAVLENQEISGRSSNSNPRTAIGQIDELHYIILVSDGRTKASAGLSLYELATLFKERGCFVAYNLDGGGSSTMVFAGRIVNTPTTAGRRTSEREVSDIVYIGY